MITDNNIALQVQTWNKHLVHQQRHFQKYRTSRVGVFEHQHEVHQQHRTTLNQITQIAQAWV